MMRGIKAELLANSVHRYLLSGVPDCGKAGAAASVPVRMRFRSAGYLNFGPQPRRDTWGGSRVRRRPGLPRCVVPTSIAGPR